VSAVVFEEAAAEVLSPHDAAALVEEGVEGH
jgi:hypothetical protein